MCGIAGQVRADGSCVDPAVVAEMRRALEHRGPDSRGLHCQGQVGLGIQRLRVIDLDTGDQPIFNEDRSISVVLTGEIYNYRALRQELRDAPKNGFGLDASRWLRSEMRDLLRDTVGDGVAARGYFRPSFVNDLVDLHLAGRADHSSKLWALMMFELRHREFVDRRPTP